MAEVSIRFSGPFFDADVAARLHHMAEDVQAEIAKAAEDTSTAPPYSGTRRRR